MSTRTIRWSLLACATFVAAAATMVATAQPAYACGGLFGCAASDDFGTAANPSFNNGAGGVAQLGRSRRPPQALNLAT